MCHLRRWIPGTRLAAGLTAGLLLGFPAIMLLSRAAAAPEQVRPPAIAPAALLWRAGLSELGFPPLPWSSSAQARSSFESLGFAGGNVLVAAFLAPESAAPYSPRRVHCILLDARTGRVLGWREWSVLMSRVGLLATREGRFAVRTNQALTLYSANFQPVAKFPMPIRTAAFDQWEIGVTPDRRLLVVQQYTDQKTDIWWLDSATLAPRRSWSSTAEKFVDDWTGLRMSDDLLARTLLASVQVRGIAGPWAAAFTAGPGFVGQLSARFIAARRLLVSEGGFLSVVRDDGRRLLTAPLEQGEFFAADDVRVSADGRRFAIPVTVFGGGGALQGANAQPPLGRIVVYDWPSHRWLCELNDRRPGLKSVWAFALSPDGSLLALAAGGSVEVYRLPR